MNIPIQGHQRLKQCSWDPCELNGAAAWGVDSNGCRREKRPLQNWWYTKASVKRFAKRVTKKSISYKYVIYF